MNRAIGISVFCLGITFFTGLFISTMNFTMQMQKLNDYHYATVHEIESSDFASTVMNERISSSDYTTTITEHGVKEDLKIFKVRTEGELKIPVLNNFSVPYVKESIAR